MDPSDRSLPPPPRAPGDATEDDGAVLRAVRAFLLDDDVICALDSDEEESRFVAFSGGSSTESSGSATEAPPVIQRKAPTATKGSPARPRMVNRSRVRLQNEIFSLRQQSIALERRLAQIQRDGSNAASATSDSTAGKPTLDTPWQVAAFEQRQRATAAQRERQQLRKKVSNYKRAIKRVRHFVRQQTRKQSTFANLLPLGISRQTVLHPDAPIDFEDISEHLDSMYAQLDSVFQDEELDSVTHVTDELNKMRIQNEDSLNMSLEFVRSRVLPFDVATTAKAVWYYHTVKAGGVGAQVQVTSQDTENVLRGSIVSTVSFPHFKGHAHGRWETRRFVDKDRIIILRCSIFHRLEGAGEGMDGFRVRMLDWIVVSPPRDERVRAAPELPASHVDSFEVVMPFFAEGSIVPRDTPKGRAGLKAFCVASTESVHTLQRQAIENILLGGA
jgi:hypothetical protein